MAFGISSEGGQTLKNWLGPSPRAVDPRQNLQQNDVIESCVATRYPQMFECRREPQALVEDSVAELIIAFGQATVEITQCLADSGSTGSAGLPRVIKDVVDKRAEVGHRSRRHRNRAREIMSQLVGPGAHLERGRPVEHLG